MTESGVAPSNAPARLVPKWRELLDEIGLIVPLSLGLFVVGVLVQHFSSLPTRYTWLEPFRTMWRVFGVADFPACIVGVLAIGVVARSGEWKIPELANVLDSDITLPRVLRVTGRALLGGLAAAMDSFLFRDHTPLDAFAIVLLVTVLLSRPRIRFETAKVLVGQAIVGTLCFCAISYAFTVIKATLLIGAMPKDALIVGFETHVFGEPVHRMVTRFAAGHMHFVDWCDWAYFRFFNHMWLTTIFLTAIRLHRERTEYFGALVITYAIGAPLYHLLPGYGPLFYEPQYYAYIDHIPLMASNIRDWLLLNTNAVKSGTAPILNTWSYIACFPSLHIAHELVMLWYARHSKLAFGVALAFTVLTSLSVMVLGWHYFSDMLGGVVVATIAIALAHKSRDVLMPKRIAGMPDDPVPPRNLSIAALRAELARKAG